jgi:hypothetical protein
VSASLADLVAACTRLDPGRRPTAWQALEALRALGPEVWAPAVVCPTNLGFDWPAREALPPGWCDSQGFVAGVSAAYELGVAERPDRPGGRCARLARAHGPAEEFGALMQRIPGQGLGGRALHLEAEVCTEGVRGWAGLWLRVDGPGRTLFFDNMRDRPLRGSTPWATHRLSVALPPETAWVNYGALLAGVGTVWIDDVRVLVRDARGALVPLRLWSAESQRCIDGPTT